MIFQNFQVLKCIKPKFTNFPGFQGGVRTLTLSLLTKKAVHVQDVANSYIIISSRNNNAQKRYVLRGDRYLSPIL